MELVNAMYKYDVVEKKNVSLCKETLKDLLILIAPAAPHFAEEMWEQIGEKYSIHNQHYPKFDETKLAQDKIEIAVQVNSKIITRIEIATNLSNDQIVGQATQDQKVAALLDGKTIVKSIVVPNRIVNLIVK